MFYHILIDPFKVECVCVCVCVCVRVCMCACVACVCVSDLSWKGVQNYVGRFSPVISVKLTLRRLTSSERMC